MHDQPPGWYRDRDRPNVHRYWNGAEWSTWVGEELVSRADEADRRADCCERACG